MSLRYADSFDTYSNEEVLLKWTSKGATSFNIVPGRDGNGIQLTAGTALFKTLDQQPTWYVGWAVMNLGQSPPNGTIFGAANIDTSMAQLNINPDSTLTLWAGDLANIVGTSTLALHPNTWYYVEIGFTLSGSSNIVLTATVLVNGQEVISGFANTNVNKNNLIYQDSTANQLTIGSIGNIAAIIDDVYMCDGTGTSHNNFLNDIDILYVVPDGDVTITWTPTGGGTSFDQINEVPPDYDTTYVADDNPGDLDNFTWQPVSSFVGNLLAVQYSIFARKDDEGTRSVIQTMGSGAGEVDSPPWYLNDDYVYYCWPLDNNADSSGNPLPWTTGNFNSQTFGFKVNS